jgi:hypothetical protein
VLTLAVGWMAFFTPIPSIPAPASANTTKIIAWG